MSDYRVKLSRNAAKQLEKLDPTVRDRVVAALREIGRDPSQGTKLHPPFAGLRRYRVGDYRITYDVSGRRRVVAVANIRHRRGAYRW